MNAMNLFNRLWSSQSGTQVKVEQNSDERNPQEGNTTNGAHSTDEMPGNENEGETPVYTDWEGFPDEELNRVDTVVATTSAEPPKNKKKKKKKKKRKRQSDPAAEGLQVETSRPADSSSPKDGSLIDVIGESAMNRDIEGLSALEEPVLDDLPVPKHSRKTNGTAPKRNQALKSTARVATEDGAAGEDERSPETAGLVDGASTGKTIRDAETKKSSQGAPELQPAGPETAHKRNGDAMAPAMPRSMSPEEYQERTKWQKNGSSRTAHEIGRHSHPVNGDPAALSELSIQTRHSDSDVQEEATVGPASRIHLGHHVVKRGGEDTALSLSPQLQQDLRSIPHPASGNGDTEEQEPKRPSKKALGKRKAFDEPLLNPTKKLKHRKNKEPSGRDLRDFGFVRSDTGSRSPRGSSSSNHSPSLLTDIARQVWEENNGISKEPELTYNSQASIKSPKSSWNAVNLPSEPKDEAETRWSLFVSNQKPLESGESTSNANDFKRSRPIIEIWPMESTPSMKPPVTAAKSTSKMPKTPKNRAVIVSAASTSKPVKASTPSASRGKLSTNQLDALTAAVESYREFNDLTDFQLNDRIHADAKDKFAQQMWRDVCEEVPNIPRRNVMDTCRRRYYNFKRGPWEQYEDDELKQAHGKHPGKWKLIGEIMNRFPEDVRDRWRNYVVCGDSMKKAGWDLDEEQCLRVAVKQCIEETRRQSRFASDRVLDEDSFIDWGKVSELMRRTRSRIQCRDKWMKLKDREDSGGDDFAAKLPISETWRMETAALDARLFSAEEKLTLLRAIRDTGAAREGKIPWQTLKDELEGKGKRMAWKYCFRKLQECVPRHKHMDFKEVVTRLVHAFEEAAPNEPDGFDLPIEIFPSSQNTSKRAKHRKRATNDDEERPSSPTKKRSRGRKQAQDDHDENSEAAPVSSAGRRTFRDRMLKEGDSQETATSYVRSVSADITADVTQDFASIKRTPKSAAKYVIRNSKRNIFLSEEKVIEDPSDDEKPAKGAKGEEMDLDHDASDNAASESEPAPEDDVNDEEVSDEFDYEEFDNMRRSAEGSSNFGTRASGPAAEDDLDDEELPNQSSDEEDYGSRRNVGGSPDLDTPVRGHSFKTRLDSPIHLNGFHDNEEEVSSDDDFMSDIPAVRLPRMESVEL